MAAVGAGGRRGGATRHSGDLTGATVGWSGAGLQGAPLPTHHGWELGQGLVELRTGIR